MRCDCLRGDKIITDIHPERARPELAATLRRLRRERGLSQRALAKALNFGSHSSIADIESDKRMPGMDVVRAYERYFEISDRSLTDMHRAALREAARDDADVAPAEHVIPLVSSEPESGPAISVDRRWRVVSMTTIMLVVVAAVVLARPFASGGGPNAQSYTPSPGWKTTNQNTAGRPESSASATAASTDMDGDDPRARGCQPEAVVLDQVPLLLPGGSQFGTLRLRHNATCMTSWASALYDNPQLYTVYLVAHRDRDDGKVQSDYTGNLGGSYGDMLSTSFGCVWVEAWVVTPTRTGPRARTACK